MIGQLEQRFNLAKTPARDAWHLTNQITRKRLAHTIGVWLNLEHGRESLQFDGVIIAQSEKLHIASLTMLGDRPLGKRDRRSRKPSQQMWTTDTQPVGSGSGRGVVSRLPGLEQHSEFGFQTAPLVRHGFQKIGQQLGFLDGVQHQYRDW